MKNFDEWNEVKKTIQYSMVSDRTFFYEREVWWVRLGINIGDEEDGKDDGYIRPVIILRKYSKRSFLAIPMSSVTKSSIYYYEFNFKGENVSAILSQIRFMDSRRLFKIEGKISKEEFAKLIKTTIEVNFQ